MTEMGDGRESCLENLAKRGEEGGRERGVGERGWHVKVREQEGAESLHKVWRWGKREKKGGKGQVNWCMLGQEQLIATNLFLIPIKPLCLIFPMPRVRQIFLDAGTSEQNLFAICID